MKQRPQPLLVMDGWAVSPSRVFRCPDHPRTNFCGPRGLGGVRCDEDGRAVCSSCGRWLRDGEGKRYRAKKKASKKEKG